jgi:hypothetical protein
MCGAGKNAKEQGTAVGVTLGTLLTLASIAFVAAQNLPPAQPTSRSGSVSLPKQCLLRAHSSERIYAQNALAMLERIQKEQSK